MKLTSARAARSEIVTSHKSRASAEPIQTGSAPTAGATRTSFTAARVGLELLSVGGHERGAGDDEAEGEEAGADLEWPGADGFAEDEDAAEDGGEVRRDRGEGDDLDGRPE